MCPANGENLEFHLIRSKRQEINAGCATKTIICFSKTVKTMFESQFIALNCSILPTLPRLVELAIKRIRKIRGKLSGTLEFGRYISEETI